MSRLCEKPKLAKSKQPGCCQAEAILPDLQGWATMPTGLLSVDILGTCVDFCLRYHENRFLSKMAVLRSADPSYVAAKGLQDIVRAKDNIQILWRMSQPAAS